MNRLPSVIIFLVMTVLLFSCNNAGIPESVFQESEDPYLSKIGQDLYMVENFNNGGNVCFLVARDGVLVVDAGYYPSGMNKVIDLIGMVTDTPVKYVVYTHCHTDHVGGIAAFNNDITIIAHENLTGNLDKHVRPSLTRFKDELEEVGEDSLRVKYGDLFDDIMQMRIMAPEITFKEQYEIDLGNYNIELHFPGVCHTTDNIFVLFKEQKVLHTGDLVFNQRHPFISKIYESDPSNWRDAIASWAQEDLNMVVPGHGEKGGSEILKAQSDYLTTLISVAEEYRDKDMSFEAIAEEIHKENFSEWEYAGYFVSTIEVLLDKQ